MRKPLILPLISAVLLLPAAVVAQETDAEFNKIDANGDGYITVEELSISQRDTLDDQNEKTLSVLDKNGDGFVVMSEYVDFYSSLSKEKSHKELQDNFRALDTDSDDKLNVREIKYFRENTFDETNQSIIDSLDTDKDDRISHEEFDNFIKSMHLLFDNQ